MLDPAVSNPNPQESIPPQLPVREVWDPNTVRTELLVHVIFLVMGGAVILMSVLMRAEGQSQVYLPGWDQPLPPSCTTKILFGYDCPGCGMTRAFISISSGQLSRAWSFNAASFIVYPFVAVQVPWNLLQIGLLVRRQRAIVIPHVHFLPIAVVVVLAVHWLWRLSVQAW